MRRPTAFWFLLFLLLAGCGGGRRTPLEEIGPKFYAHEVLLRAPYLLRVEEREAALAWENRPIHQFLWLGVQGEGEAEPRRWHVAGRQMPFPEGARYGVGGIRMAFFHRTPNLSPGRAYRYRLCLNWPCREGQGLFAGRFVTPAAGGKGELSFVVVGEPGWRSPAGRRLASLLARLLEGAPAPLPRGFDLGFVLGNLSPAGAGKAALDANFFSVFQPALARAPFHPVLGPQEARDACGGPVQEAFWPPPGAPPLYPEGRGPRGPGRRARSSEPPMAAGATTELASSPSPGGGRYYAFERGSSLFVVLDSNAAEDYAAGAKGLPPRCKALRQCREVGGEERCTFPDLRRHDPTQRAWLVRVLARSRARWKFVFMHHPLFSAGRRTGAEEQEALRRRLFRIFRVHGVDVVFAARERHYERSLQVVAAEAEGRRLEFAGGRVVRGRPVLRKGRGVLFVVSGGGGAPPREGLARLPGVAGVDAMRPRVPRAAEAFHFVHVRVRGGSLTLTAWDEAGRMIDRAEIREGLPAGS